MSFLGEAMQLQCMTATVALIHMQDCSRLTLKIQSIFLYILHSIFLSRAKNAPSSSKPCKHRVSFWSKNNNSNHCCKLTPNKKDHQQPPKKHSLNKYQQHLTIRKENSLPNSKKLITTEQVNTQTKSRHWELWKWPKK